MAAHRTRRHDHPASSSNPGATVIDVGTNARRKSRRGGANFRRIRRKSCASFDKKGAVLVGDVHPIDVRRSRRRVHAGAGRRRTADHRDADGEYRRIGRTPAIAVC